MFMVVPEGWKNEDGYLVRVFVLKDFRVAMDFIAKVADLAEKAKHHPDIEIFDYNRVRIKLVTHQAGNTIASRDIDLATRIDYLY